MKKILRRSYPLIGLIIFALIVRDINFRALYEQSTQINFFYLALASSLYLPIIFLKSYRWQKIMVAQKISYAWREAFLMYGSSTLLGMVTPGRLGDLSKIIYLKKKHSLGRAAFSSILEKILDLASVTFFIIIGMLWLPSLPYFSVNYALFIKGSVIAAAIGSIACLALYKRFTWAQYFFADIVTDLKHFPLKKWGAILPLTLANWLTYFSIIYLTAHSIGLTVRIDFFYLSFLASLIIIAALLPISILNIGPRDTILVFFLLPLGIPKETIILFSFLIMANYLSLFLISLFCWLKKPVI